MFNFKIKYISSRKGERYASALTKMNLGNKVYKRFSKLNIKDYIDKFLALNEK